MAPYVRPSLSISLHGKLVPCAAIQLHTVAAERHRDACAGLTFSSPRSVLTLMLVTLSHSMTASGPGLLASSSFFARRP